MFRFSRQALSKNLIPVLPSNNTAIGMVDSTDIDKLVIQSSGRYGLLANTTASTESLPGKIAGIVASVPDESTAGSTVPFYIRPILTNEIIEADYAGPALTTESTAGFATTGAHSLVNSTNIGYFYGTARTTDSGTVEYGAYLDPSTGSSIAGTNLSNFFELLSVDTDRRKVTGRIHSSNLA